MSKITHVDIRMYGTGTGDCFILKFFSDKTETFTMMIDGGTWKGTKSHLAEYVKDIKKYINNKLDLLVITHEHKDHVYLFDACSDLFINDFNVDQIWMAWSEDDDDETVKNWKKEFGQKKKALAIASDEIKKVVKRKGFTTQFNTGFKAKEILEGYNTLSESLNDFKELHFSADGAKVYKGGLKGMEIIKKDIANNNIDYLKPGSIETLSKLPGVKFNILGPPVSIKAIKKEHGKKNTDDTYDHNKVLKRSDSFSAAVTQESSMVGSSPFSKDYFSKSEKLKRYYKEKDLAWRKIDYDWLVSGAGNLALRLNTGINNLSLAIAIEFESSKKVMLFPGDAEFGSWESWHNIDWDVPANNNNTHHTEDLLNRTVFYKVAHHLSHNGTAKEKGLKMMKSKDLIAMATLDFDAISTNWKSTMPNRGILKDLLEKTKGRLIIMNEKDLFYDFNEDVPLKKKIKSERLRLNTQERNDFKNHYKESKLKPDGDTILYKQYRVSVN